MTAARPACAQQDVCQFLCVHGTATFTFGMSFANVWERSKLLDGADVGYRPRFG